MKERRKSNHHSKSRHKKSSKPQRSSFDKYVDRLHDKNVERLKQLNRYPYQNTDGEEAIKRSLLKNKIRYVREYIVENLKGDSKNYRAVDFYLPKYDVFLEFLGNWNTSIDHKERYREKMRVYAKNNVKAVYIYPNQLYNISWVLKKELEKIDANAKPYTKETSKAKQSQPVKKKDPAVEKYLKDFEIKKSLGRLYGSNNSFSEEWKKAQAEENSIKQKIESIISIIYKLAKGFSIAGLAILVIALFVGFFNQGVASNFLKFYWILGIGLALFVWGFIMQVFYVVVENIFIWFKDLFISIKKLF